MKQTLRLIKTAFTLLILLTSYKCLPAQTFNWARQTGDTLNDVGSSIAADASGNVYSTGFFFGTVDFDPGAATYNLISAGSNDIFISKSDSAGNFIWAKQMGGTDVDNSLSIAVDAAGNIYSTGFFKSTADFDPGTGVFNLTSAGLDDIFISKLDSSGNFLWAKQMGGTDIENSRSIALDDLGNVYTTGYFLGTADFDPGTGVFNLTSAGGTDIFISKLNSAGIFLWGKQIGGAGGGNGNAIAVDDSANVYTTGVFQATSDFDPGAATFNLTSAGSNDIFISKLDSAGNFAWAKQIGGTDLDHGLGIAVDVSGNVYATGFFKLTVDFDPGASTFNLTAAGDCDIFIFKSDSSGNFLWAAQMGGADFDFGRSIAVDASGNVYTTGNFRLTSDFDPGAGTFNLTSAGLDDIFIFKSDPSGNFLWAGQMGGTDYDYGSFIAADVFGNVYITGYFYGTADFDPGAGVFNLTSAGSNDIFICKLSDESTAIMENDFVRNFKLYPNPGNGKFKFTNNNITSIEVYNLIGEKVYDDSCNANAAKNELDISHFSKGMYFVKVLAGNKVFIPKVIIE